MRTHVHAHDSSLASDFYAIDSVVTLGDCATAVLNRIEVQQDMSNDDKHAGFSVWSQCLLDVRHVSLHPVLQIKDTVYPVMTASVF